MKKQMIIMLGSVGTLFVLIFGYKAISNYMMMNFMLANSNPPVTVSAMKAEYQEWQQTLELPGTLRAVQGVDVTTELAGLVRKIFFTPGTQVKKGDILVELNIDADVAHLIALEAQSDLANTNYTRDKKQFEIKAVSQAILDADVAELKNRNALVAEQKAMVDKKIIRSPFAGRLGISFVNLGQYIIPGEKIVTLQSLNPIYVDFFVPQQAIAKINKGQIIKLRSDAFPKQTFIGKVMTIEPKADVITRNTLVEAIIENPKYQLLPGMFGTVEMHVGEPANYLTLPKTAVSYNSYGDIAYIIKESKDKDGKSVLIAHQSFIVAGESRGDQIAIISGIKAGDMVVTSGQLKLKNNSEVIINNSIVPTNDKNPMLKDN